MQGGVVIRVVTGLPPLTGHQMKFLLIVTGYMG